MTDTQNNGKADRIDCVDSYKEAAPLLRQPFTAEAVRFKVQATFGSPEPDSALIVAYIDARLVVERLNLVCPHLWHDEYESVGDKLMLCKLTVDGITRQDVGSGYVGKGLYSDAFKRAGVKFGVGVSLYSVPQIFLKVAGGHLKVKNTSKGATLVLTPNGETRCRDLYATWLKAQGQQTFGEPLDHGDTAESVGDVEAYVDPDAALEPTDEQRTRVKELCKELDVKGDDRLMLFRSHGVEEGVASTRQQVADLIADLERKRGAK